MRMIGTIPNDTDAERFSDYLLAQGMENMVEESSSGDDWQVWIEHDDDLDRAKSELEAFLRVSADTKYDAVGSRAEKIRKEEEKKQQRRQKQFIDVRTRWGQPRQWAAPVTLALIAISCVISLGTKSITRDPREPLNQSLDMLLFTSVVNENYQGWQVEHPEAVTTSQVWTGYWLSHLARGQVWRLITPIFVHWSILHLIFNMFWTRDLGGMIELQRGTWRLLGLVLGCAVLSNIGQYYWEGPSKFGGMSGVVYGLFGYVWIKSRYQPHLGLGVSKQTATIMVAWLFLCMTGMVGSVANAAHVVGLIVGAAIGYAPTAARKLRRIK
ncbi:MAG: rhomboid family intramembrane serine protease [Tepidisphaeraceae bacterium]